jgi:RimJ/RimL family protein N-acetyltransferase
MILDSQGCRSGCLEQLGYAQTGKGRQERLRAWVISRPETQAGAGGSPGRRRTDGPGGRQGGTRAEFAIEGKNSGEMLGLVGLEACSRAHASADLTFLLKVPFWGQGYATEAAGAVVWFGFKRLKLNRICATLLVRNTASARVLGKLGMTREGVMREAARRGDKFEDLVMVSLLRQEWAARTLRATAHSLACKIRARKQAGPPQPRPATWLFPHETSHMASKLPVGGPPGLVGVRPGEGPGRTAVPVAG